MKVETREYKGYQISIETDDYPSNPRKEWDNMAHMVCWHRHYDLGDKHDFDSPEDFQEYMKENKVLVFPLYLYDHSGITISMAPFSCPWDSGQVGYIYVTYAELRKEYCTKKVTKSVIEKATRVLRGEVEVYDAYITGEVFGWTIGNDEDENIDSCWGYYGTSEIDYMFQEAKSSIDYHIEQAKQEQEKENFKNEMLMTA